jgi:hypothetical protein
VNWKAISTDFLRFVAAMVAAAIAYALLRQTRLYEFTANEFEGLNTIILLVGGIYSVVFAFVIFVIWGQFTDVQNAVMRECNILNDLLRFSDHLNPEAGRSIRRDVADYSQLVLKHEWQALAQRRRDRQSDRAFSDLMDLVLRTVPAGTLEYDVHQRLIDIVRKAGEHRDERIAKSLTRIPPTLERLVLTMAGVLLLLVFVYPFHHPVAGFVCFLLVAIVLFLARLVMTDTDNPFEGVCNVSPQPFGELSL